MTLSTLTEGVVDALSLAAFTTSDGLRLAWPGIGGTTTVDWREGCHTLCN